MQGELLAPSTLTRRYEARTEGSALHRAVFTVRARLSKFVQLLFFRAVSKFLSTRFRSVFECSPEFFLGKGGQADVEEGYEREAFTICRAQATNALDPGFIYDTSKGRIKVGVGPTTQQTGLVDADGHKLWTPLWG